MIILPSATIKSPASRITMSPLTTFFESISIFSPLRITLALGDESDFKLSRVFSALICCTVPKIALRIITAKITTVPSKFPEKIEIIAAIIRIITNKSAN